MMFTDPLEWNYTLTEEEANSPMNIHLRGLTKAVESKAYHERMLSDICKLVYDSQMHMLENKKEFSAGLAYDMGLDRPRATKNWSKMPRLILEETDILIFQWKKTPKNQRIPRTLEQIMLMDERTVILHVVNDRFLLLMKQIWTPLELSPMKVRHFF